MTTGTLYTETIESLQVQDCQYRVSTYGADGNYAPIKERMAITTAHGPEAKEDSMAPMWGFP